VAQPLREFTWFTDLMADQMSGDLGTDCNLGLTIVKLYFAVNQ